MERLELLVSALALLLLWRVLRRVPAARSLTQTQRDYAAYETVTGVAVVGFFMHFLVQGADRDMSYNLRICVLSRKTRWATCV